ncbi:MAG: RecB family exonuclease [Nocardioidaceae bacterium]
MASDLLEDPTDDIEPRTAVDGVNVLGSLSPSRASDFMSCPLRYRLRVIDKIPEAPSSAAVRGTVVHGVLENLFDEPAEARTLQRATELVRPQWEAMLEREPDLASLFDGDDALDLAGWLGECGSLLKTYFELEDPQRLEPAEREVYVEHVLDSKLLIRGYIDRVDVARTGEVRIVDYKSGRSPGELFEAKALFQMRFYALVLWRTSGEVPTLLQLIYLGNGEILRYAPDEADLLATERKVNALWDAIARATATGNWPARKSALCGWCDHKSRCPEWGGTPPPLPADATVAATPGRGDRRPGCRRQDAAAGPRRVRS